MCSSPSAPGKFYKLYVSWVQVRSRCHVCLIDNITMGTFPSFLFSPFLSSPSIGGQRRITTRVLDVYAWVHSFPIPLQWRSTSASPPFPPFSVGESRWNARFLSSAWAPLFPQRPEELRKKLWVPTLSFLSFLISSILDCLRFRIRKNGNLYQKCFPSRAFGTGDGRRNCPRRLLFFFFFPPLAPHWPCLCRRISPPASESMARSFFPLPFFPPHGLRGES